MLVPSACPGCQQPLRLRPSYLGRPVRCPVCATSFLPRAEEAPPALLVSVGADRPRPTHVPAPASNGAADTPAGPPAGPRPWFFGPRLGPVALALLPLLLPLLRGGAGWLLLGAGLAVLGVLPALFRRCPASVRWFAALGVTGVAFALLARSFLLSPSANQTPTVRGAPGEPPPLPPALPGLGMMPQLAGGARLDAPLPGSDPSAGGAVHFVERKPEPLAPAPGKANVLRLAGRVRRWLAFAADPARGAAFASTPEGLLRHYSYPGFRLLRTYRLGQPAYRLVLDSRHGLLHAAVSEPDFLGVGPLGEVEQARGDLWTFDVKPLLAGKARDGEALRPTATVSLRARLLDLLPSPDGRRLYYLTAAERMGWVGSLDALSGRMGKPRALRGGGMLLRASPDGKTLYVLTGGGVLALDPDSLDVTRAVTLPGPVSGMAAADGGRVFLAHRSRAAEVYAVDVKQLKVEGCWSAPLRGGLELVLHPDQKGFFLGNSAVAGRRILSVRPEADLGRPATVVGEARSDGSGVLGGTFDLTPDGRFLVDSGGKIYRIETRE